MKFSPSISLKYLPWYVLISSVFFSSIFIQYAALLFFLVAFFGSNKPVIKINAFFIVVISLLIVSFASYLYNLINQLADVYTILFWLFSYVPPLVLILILQTYSKGVDFIKIYKFYKLWVYLESFLMIFSAIKHGRYVVGDPATGTVGDANWVAFHICVVLIYEISKFITLWKQKEITLKNGFKKISVIIYFFVILLIPESTANLGFLMIVLGVAFVVEFVVSNINFTRILILSISISLSFYLISQSFVYKRIDDAIEQLSTSNISKNPYLSKVYIYTKLINGEIYSNTNWLLGSGPATFTSRSSVMRMPDERVNEFPLELPYFKSYLFKKYISPIYAGWRQTRESHGNFASPQTSVISIAVELGVAGCLCVFALFYYIFKRISKLVFSDDKIYLKKFVFYLSLFYLINLFHLNFWEYPIITFTYFIFLFLILKDSSVLSVSESDSPNM
ncbi:MAG: hypothetical protein WBM13_05425 [Bacteroidia bacterium]